MSDIERGWTLIELNRPTEAEQVARELLATDPTGVEAYRLLGSALDELGRAAEAEQVLRSGLALAPDSDQLLIALAEVLSQLDRHDEARQAALRAVHLDPHWWGNHYAYARTALAGRRPLVRDALAAAQRSVELAPHSPHSHNLLGMAWEAFNHPNEARAACTEALRLDPQYASAMSNLADLDSGIFRLGKAARGFTTAAALDPHSTQLRANVEVLAARLARRAYLLIWAGALVLLVMVWAKVDWPIRAAVGVALVTASTVLIYRSLRLLPRGLRHWRALLVDIRAEHGIQIFVVAIVYVGLIILSFAPNAFAEDAGIVMLRIAQVMLIVLVVSSFVRRRKERG